MKKNYLSLIACMLISTYGIAQWSAPLNNNIYTINTGNVGIGTTTPSSALDVAGLIQISGVNSVTPPSGLSYGLFGYSGVGLGIYSGASSPDQGIGFWTNLNNVKREAIRINSNGDLGIGTVAPTQKLDVNGNAIVKGSLISSIADANIGGTIQINNPAKTANGAASSWQIFNMSGNYGNSLQFWAYDNLGCGQPNGLCASRFTLMDNGNVGIGTTIPNSKLAVNGNIRAREIKVENDHWPDYVFAKSYELPSLRETERYINENGHLPGIPSAVDVKANGVDLGEMNAKLLQKIEELTLHLIEKDKQIKSIKSDYQELKKMLMDRTSKKD